MTNKIPQFTNEENMIGKKYNADYPTAGINTTTFTTTKTPQGNEKSIKSVLEELVYPMVGPRCKSKDTDEFEYKNKDGRCLVCTTYEQVDQALKEIKSICEEVIGEDEDDEIAYIETIGSEESFRNELKAEQRCNLNKLLGKE